MAELSLIGWIAGVISAFSIGGCLLPPLPEPLAQPSPSSTAVDPEAPQRRDDGRLPQLAVPLRYDLELDIDPARDDFSGRTTIALSIVAPTRYIVLDAGDLNVVDVSLEIAGKKLVATHQMRKSEPNADSNDLVLHFAETVPAGRGELHLSYGAHFRQDSRGLFRVNRKDRWYAFSQLEPTDARRVFPCIDEPAYKVPFRVAIISPPGSHAISNMPEISRADRSTGTRIEFAETPPLPTYLVAFAVGEFEIDEGPHGTIPLRLFRTKGAPGRPAPALETARDLLAVLADDFERPYPFSKLDLVAIPDFEDSAMENPGLVTLNEAMLLPVRASQREERTRDQMIAHELAHQWLGNLVTLEWWNDAWLNEGFATFAELRALERWRPSLGARRAALSSVRHWMRQDAEGSTEPVRAPVRTEEDARRVLHNNVAYVKGAALMAMVERYVGHQPFHMGVRNYLERFAWKSANTSDLVDELERASGKSLANLFHGFLDETGVASVELTPHCASGKLVSIDVTKETWRHRQSERDWNLPLCLSFDGGPAHCSELAGRETTLPFSAQDFPCPKWIDPNPGSSGYYRRVVTDASIVSARAAWNKMSAEAKTTFLDDAWSSVVRRRALASSVMQLLKLCDAERDSGVVQEELYILDELRRATVASDLPAFHAYLAARLRLAKERNGLAKGARLFQDDDSAALRLEVARALGRAGDEDMLRASEEWLTGWLGQPDQPLESASAYVLWEIAAPRARQRFDELLAQLENPARRENRDLMASHLGLIDDPALLRRMLDATLRLDLDVNRVGMLFRSAAVAPRTHHVFFQWLVSEWTRVHAKWGRTGAFAPVVNVLAHACTDDERVSLERRARSTERDQNRIDELASWAIKCRDFQQAAAPSIAQFLRTRLASYAPPRN